MTSFAKWCSTNESKVSTHTVTLLSAEPEKLDDAKKLIAAAVPDYYTNPSRVAALLTKLGKDEAAAFVKGKLPTGKSLRSGELGEVLCNAYVLEISPFQRGIRRLRWRDHREMSMRGEDVLAFRFDATGKLRILKAEVKSAKAMNSTIVNKARDSLSAYSELPSPHALSFVADRLHETGEDVELADAIDAATLKDGIELSQITHLLFTFSGNNAGKILTDNLTKYGGSVKQKYVGLRVETHQQFIREVYELVAQ